MSTGQKPQFPAGYSAKAALKSTAPDGAKIAERLRRWTYGDYDTHAVLSMAGERVATVPLIAHAEAIMGDAWQAASHIEAQDAEIARLRAADVLGIVARQAAEWRAEAETMGRIVRGAHTAGDLHTMAGAADKLFLSLKTALAPQETQE